ncbi:hypothetical protein [Stenomitos frigidus]|uniref:hypothetical protein n=1 Tax=Stenomitos frigidus TaxID=1886765 RepID=UPI0011B27327|nr:hypothetical protein [Stenomitos frigidus]
MNNEQRLALASQRRAALSVAGCSTYVLGSYPHEPAIICLCCGRGSFNLTDAKRLYCAFCDAWHTATVQVDAISSHSNL